jgi:ABC-type multidrug transport system ATPase subunit
MKIQAFHLTKVHPSGAKVLDDAFFSFSEASFNIILGENNSGKSTLLKMLAGEDKPTSGVLRVGLGDPYTLSAKEKREWLNEVGMFFPDLSLFPDKTVKENILFTLQLKGIHPQGQEESIHKLLEHAGLSEKMNSKPADLSSGQQRMVLALRAMIFRPKLFLGDEPLQGLDPFATQVLLRLLGELRKTGTTLVITSRHAFPEVEETLPSLKGILQWHRLAEGRLIPWEGKAS